MIYYTVKPERYYKGFDKSPKLWWSECGLFGLTWDDWEDSWAPLSVYVKKLRQTVDRLRDQVAHGASVRDKLKDAEAKLDLLSSRVDTWYD